MAGSLAVTWAKKAWNCFRTCLDKLGIGGLIPISYASLETIKRLKDPVIVVFIAVFFYAVWFLHLYKGVLAHVCVEIAAPLYPRWNNSAHWLKGKNGFYETCGTHVGSKECPDGYICMEDVGPVTRHDFTTYNTISSSYLAILVIALNDNWEWLCQMVLLSKGKWNILWFVTTILTSYCVIASIQCAALAAYNKVWKSENKREYKIYKLANRQNNSGVGTQRSQTSTYIEEGLIEDHEPPLPATSQTGGRGCCGVFCDVVCGWNCCPCCDRCKNCFYKCVFNPVFQILVVLCLLTEVAVLVCDHMDYEYSLIVVYTKLAFDIIYLVEAFLKFCALGPRAYYKDGWNVYELLIVLLNFVEYGLLEIGSMGINITIFLKLFRLARFFPTFGRVLQMSNKAFGVQKNFLVVLTSFILLMAYISLKAFPFEDMSGGHQQALSYFYHIMIVLRSVSGEWVNGLWECSTTNSGWSCVPFYFVVILVGNLVLLNIFTFSLLDGIQKVIRDVSKDGEVHDAVDGTTIPVVTPTVQLMADGADFFVRGWSFVRSRVGMPARYRSSRMQARQQSERLTEAISTEILVEENTECDGETEEDKPWNVGVQNREGELGACCPTLISDCVPCACYEYQGLSNIRRVCLTISQSAVFEVLTIAIIIVSTAFLAAEDVYAKKQWNLKEMVYYSNLFISIIFMIEMSIRLTGLGLVGYFKSVWRFWDFLAVLSSGICCFFDLFGIEDLPLFRAARVIRVFRILNIGWEYEPLRVMMNTLAEAFPGMVNVLAFGLCEWVIFAIMGVSLLYNAFGTCTDEEGNDVPYREYDYYSCIVVSNMTWTPTNLNFDNLFDSFLSLCQVATIKSWPFLVHMADMYSYRAATCFLLLFIYFGAYFTYVMWMGTLIDGFNRQRQKDDASRGLKTEGDRIYYVAIKKILKVKPNKARAEPVDSTQVRFRDVTEDIRFDACVAILIISNMVSLGLPHYLQSLDFDMVLIALTIMFITVYVIEATFRILAWRMDFFDDWVNVLDAITIFLSIISTANSGIVSHYLFPPTFLRLIRLTRIVRRRGWHLPFPGINAILETVVLAFTYLLAVIFFYIALLIVYAILGMFLFGDPKRNDFTHEDFHFKDFSNSIVVLCQLLVSSGWQSFLVPLLNAVSCQFDSEGCSNRLWGFFYVTSYLLITYVTTMTFMTVVVLQMFNQVSMVRRSKVSLNALSVNFYKLWSEYDPSRTDYIKLVDLAHFVASASHNVRLSPQASAFEVSAMDIPIVEGDCVYHRDVFDAVYRRALFRKGLELSDVTNFGECPSWRPTDYELVSTTLWRKREDHCATIIQRAWRKSNKR